MTGNDITIRSTRQPGDLGLVVWLHGVGYAAETGNLFGSGFQGYVARTVAEFELENGGRGTIFFAEKSRNDGSVETLGCAAVVDRSTNDHKRAQLRWIIILPALRGTGLGKHLISTVIDFARDSGYKEILLETTSGLKASMGIYKQLGFTIFNHEKRPLWDGEQDFIEMRLAL